MRLLAELSSHELACGLQNALFEQKIEAQVREDTQVWIYNEEDTSKAQAVYGKFSTSPTPATSEKHKKPEKFVPHKTYSPPTHSLTVGIIIFCIFATYALSGPLEWVKSYFYFSRYTLGTPEIRSGEVWRIFTPIFLHGGVLHIAFNMLWLYQLGSQIEKAQGKAFFLTQMFLVAAVCNVSQYFFTGPAFIGMSGVIYGQLGFCWLMSNKDRRYDVTTDTVIFMVIWMVLCIVGVIPNVANAQHVIGFLSGTIWGGLQSGFFTRS